MTIVRWEPLRELGTLQTEMNRLFNTVFDGPPRRGGTMRRWMPAMDLLETGDHFVLRADLPGMSEEDVTIELEDSTLTISGERKTEHESESEGFYRVERASGAFSRSLTLPKGVDPEAVTARFDRGVLEVRIPKPEERKPRKISIGGASPPPSRARRGRASPAGGDRPGSGGEPRPVVLLLEIHTRAPDSRGPHRHAAARPRRGPHARVRPARHQGGRQDARGPRGRRAGLRHGARQHVPPVPHARPRADPRARRPAPLPCAGSARSSPTPAASRSSRWATARSPTRSRAARRSPARRARRRDPLDRGGGRDVPLLPRRLAEVHGPGDLDGGPGGARLGHRAGVRRVHAVPRRPRVHGALDRAHPPLAGPLPGLARRARARRARSSTGSSRAASRRTCGARPRRRSPRATSAGSRSAARSARTRTRCSRSSSGRSTSCRRAGRATCSGSARSTTSSAASSSGSTRSTARCRRGSAATAWRSSRTRQALARRPRQGALAHGRRAAARGLPVPGVRARLQPRLPALPAARPRADRAAAADDPQPRLPAAADGGLRAAIDAGTLPEAAAAVRAGAAPWDCPG